MSRNLNFEAKLRKELHLNDELVEVLCGERTGSSQEIKTLISLKKTIGNALYIEAVYLLTHKFIENPDDAQKVFKEILNHRNKMAKTLQRHLSIQVAALDYMQNIRSILKKPTIIESDQYREFTDKAIIDETTSAYGKNLLQSDLESEIEKSQRLGIPFSILFIDLDNLKQINDTYGHEIGTRVLQLVSSSIRQNLRRYDSVYRYGGDEFLVILPGDNCSQAYKTAQRIIDLLHSPVIDIPLTPTISIGIACFDNQLIKDQKTLFNCADKALYEAKQKGKNTIQVFGKSLHKIGNQQSCSVPVRAIIKGIPVVPGLGIGRIFHYCDILSREKETRDLFDYEVPNEIERIFNALEQVKRSLINEQKLLQTETDSKTASILDVHISILQDKYLSRMLETEIKEYPINAQNAVRNVFRRLSQQFRNSGYSVIKEKTFDFDDIALRLLRFLTGADNNPLTGISKQTVIFTQRLLPSDTIHFSSTKPEAIITKEGGKNSHSALIAKAMGIPLLSNIDFTQKKIENDTVVIVDGYTGNLILNPQKYEIQKFKAQKELKTREFQIKLNKSRDQNIVFNNETVKIFANVYYENDVFDILEYGADGIGLYRIESFYMLALRMPTEKQIYQKLYSILGPLKGKTIVLRLVDLGGDKTVPYLNNTSQKNLIPELRGIRFLLNYPELLRSQLRICLKLSQFYKIRILVPMITIAQEISEVKTFLKQEQQKLKKEGIIFDDKIMLGAMIETPLAIFELKQIMQFCDFISIGSNDLVQYLTATDRESIAVSRYFQSGNYHAIKLIRHIIKQTQKKKMDCILCGEIASNLNYTESLLKSGLRNFSVLPQTIPHIKNRINELNSLLS